MIHHDCRPPQNCRLVQESFRSGWSGAPRYRSLPSLPDWVPLFVVETFYWIIELQAFSILQQSLSKSRFTDAEIFCGVDFLVSIEASCDRTLSKFDIEGFENRFLLIPWKWVVNRQWSGQFGSKSKDFNSYWIVIDIASMVSIHLSVFLFCLAIVTDANCILYNVTSAY